MLFLTLEFRDFEYNSFYDQYFFITENKENYLKLGRMSFAENLKSIDDIQLLDLDILMPFEVQNMKVLDCHENMVLINQISSIGIAIFPNNDSEWKFTSIKSLRRNIHSFVMLDKDNVLILYCNASIEVVTHLENDNIKRNTLKLPMTTNIDTTFRQIQVDPSKKNAVVVVTG